jgi:dihydrofolate reductase
MRLTTTTFMTLDGVVQAPGAPDEDRTGGFDRGGWLVPYADDGMGAFIAEVFERADAFLLGRRTFEIFAGHWPHVPDDNPVAAALNRLPKYVASRSQPALQWSGSSVIGSDLVNDVKALKARSGRELQVHGSGQLVQVADCGEPRRRVPHPRLSRLPRRRTAPVRRAGTCRGAATDRHADDRLGDRNPHLRTGGGATAGLVRAVSGTRPAQDPSLSASDGRSVAGR